MFCFSCGHPAALSATMSNSRKSVGQIDGSTCDLLTCAICTEPYDDEEHLPKLLSCHHSFCQVCLVTLSSVGQKKVLPCPACREKTTLPPGGVSKLQTNFYIAQVRELVELRGAEQGECGCLKHQKKCDLFCVSCERSICGECQAEEHAGEFLISCFFAANLPLSNISAFCGCNLKCQHLVGNFPARRSQ